MATKLLKKTTITEEFVAVPDKRAKAADTTDDDLLESLGDLADTDDEDCAEDDDVEPSPSARSRSRSRRSR